MRYVTPNEVIHGNGLRIVLVQAMPSPWGQAAKAMMEYKGLAYTAAPWEGGGSNEEIVEWSGSNSAPVVAWNREKPISRWDDILFLTERLAPERPLIPSSIDDRVLTLGLCHEICGELGLGWNRRLSLFKPILDSGEAPQSVARMGEKYGFIPADVASAEARQIASLDALTKRLKRQRDAGSEYFVSKNITAVDFFWAAFCNLFDLPPPEKCPVAEQARPMFELIAEQVRAAVDPILIAHRDRIMAAHFKVPMEM
jgi:glutathione S-transferase